MGLFASTIGHGSNTTSSTSERSNNTLVDLKQDENDNTNAEEGRDRVSSVLDQLDLPRTSYEEVLAQHEEEMKDMNCFSRVRYILIHWEDRFPAWGQLLLLYFVLLLMTGFGGLIFHYCEHDHEASLLSDRAQLEKFMWQRFCPNSSNNFTNSTNNFTNSTNNFTNSSRDTDLHDYERCPKMKLVDEYAKYGLDYTYKNKWQFKYAAFFFVTTYTTIGYGLQAPTTEAGRVLLYVLAPPCILLYGITARNIGEVFISLFGSLITSFPCMNRGSFERHRGKIAICAFATLFCALSWYIEYASRDVIEGESFGKGIDTYWDAMYFLITTTLTIGYGDKMMNGGHEMMSCMVACFVATFCGVVICLIAELNQKVVDATAEIHRQSTITFVNQHQLGRISDSEKYEMDESSDGKKMSIIEINTIRNKRMSQTLQLSDGIIQPHDAQPKEM